MYVEPFDLRVSTLQITSPEIRATRPIRIVQLSDIHVERITRREREMLARVQTLQPDLILLTGDYLNIDYVNDPQTRRDGRATLAQLAAPYGVYAVTGSHGVDQPDAIQELFTGLPIHLLRDEIAPVEIAGATIDLVGVGLSLREADRATLEGLMRQVPDGRYSILLFHTPDLAEAAAAAGVDLYLAGHTHGGQIRLPWWGALVTMSAYGKRFEAGLYTLGETRLYVSRGIGMEGLHLPRARFLAPPEIVLIELLPGKIHSAILQNAGPEAP
jgi:predicted MPP superfamily phosphohydrolase